MMLAWKSAACLAAGNTLVLKPAQVSSFAFLSFEFKWLKAQKFLLSSTPAGHSVDGPEVC